MLLLHHLVVDLSPVLKVVQHLTRWHVLVRVRDLYLLADEDLLGVLRLQVCLLHLMCLGDKALLTFNIDCLFIGLRKERVMQSPARNLPRM